jgi:hypothetical protein
MGFFAGSLHLFVLLCVLAFIVLSVYPIYRIISRTGHSGWWCLVSFIPGLNWIFIWVFAFVPWPTVDGPYERR